MAERHHSWLEGYLAWLDDKEVPRVVGAGARSPEGLTDVGPGYG